MIKIYLDWNIMSQMKNGNYPELLDILSNDEKFFKIYSTAHIGDIYSSYSGKEQQEEYIKSDLEFISLMSHDYCAYTDDQRVVVEPYDPKELFGQRKIPVSPFADTDLLNPSDHSGSDVDQLREQLFKLPMGDIFRDAYNDPKSADVIKKWYPDLEKNQTFGGLLASTMERFRRLNEDGDYKDMRQMVQKELGINRDKIFDSADPIQEIEKVYKKWGQRPYFKKFQYVPEWYGDILNWYLLLDMHGYQEDKVNVAKGRKETFKNMTNDAFHAAFASTCDFYITNDERSFKKTVAVYNKLELNTMVLKPEGFIDHYKANLSNVDVKDHLLLFFELINRPDYQFAEDELSTLMSFYFPNFILDYFTRAHISYDKSAKENLIFLSKDKPTNGKWTFTIELETLIRKMNSFFGADMDNYGQLTDDEHLSEVWKGRRWQLEKIIFRLTMRNGWLQLYVDFEKEPSVYNHTI